MNRRHLLGIVVAIIAAPLLSTAAQQEVPKATPAYSPVADGLRASVARYFSSVSDNASGVVYVEVRIAEFESSDQALEVIPLWFDQIKRFPDDNYTVQISPVGVEQIADSSQLMVGDAIYSGNDDYVFDIMALAVVEGNLLYSFVTWSTYSVGESAIVDMAKRTLGISDPEFPPIPGVGYETGGLWDQLPRIEDMPQGLTWNRDFAPCVGVFGINACPQDDDPPVSTPTED